MQRTSAIRKGGAKEVLRALFREAGVTLGPQAEDDVQVRDSRFYDRVLGHGTLGLGESYVDGWWDSQDLDAVIHSLLSAGLQARAARSPRVVSLALRARARNLQRKRSARYVRAHYDRDLELFEAMLDARMVYSCAYWRHASTLDEAQEAKLELICRKAGLHEGSTLLDIGCGWGSLVRYAAERYGVRATGITVSPAQTEVARSRCAGLPVEIRTQDYRDVDGSYDAVVSVGMFEHVGTRNFRTYMKTVDRCLASEGVALIHTIAGNEPTRHIDPWIHRYIFPGAVLPTPAQIAAAAEGRFILEDVHNLGPDYDRTLLEWHRNFEEAWPRLGERYEERFHRLWRYYLLSCAGAFRARTTQVLQVVLTRPGTPRRHLSLLEPEITTPQPIG